MGESIVNFPLENSFKLFNFIFHIYLLISRFIFKLVIDYYKTKN